MEKRKCVLTGQEFEITAKEKAFYNTMSLPLPTLCPDERQRRRLAWRNIFNLYHRKCDGTGKMLLSVYSEDKPFPVYDVEHWYGDGWNALDFGRDFDFSRPFFPQFQELYHQVPQPARSVVQNQNSDYVNQTAHCKDCYLVFETGTCESCLYGYRLRECRDCVECLQVVKSELCYECVHCQDCYDLRYSQDCKNCSESWFLKACIGCKNCFGCVNLMNKEYYFLNQPCTKEEYEAKMAEWDLKSYEALSELKDKFSEFVLTFPHKYLQGVQNEGSSGDYLSNTQRCEACYDLQDSQDCKFVFEAEHTKDSQDVTVFGGDSISFCYDCHEIGDGVENLRFCDQCWESSYNLDYCKLCMKNSHDLFGCVGLKKASYCILNKQYSEEEYTSLRDKIITHMKKTGEWGQFFPVELSPYAYNETSAQEYYPLTKEIVLRQGWKWKPKDPKEYKPATIPVPEDIEQVEDSICQEVLACQKCGKNYQIQKSELKFYRKMNLPIPRSCFTCHHQQRVEKRNPRKLHPRQCDNCSTSLQTTFAPERPQPVYCEKCYLAILE